MSSHKSTFRSRQESEKLKVNNNPLKFTVLEEPAHPSFAFDHFSEKEYGFEKCSMNDYAALLKKLKMLSLSDWNTINSAPRHGLGYEKLSKDILNVKLPSDIPEDANLYAFRYKGKHPMVGFRKGDVFHIIFLDIDFTLYNHE